MTQSPLNPQPNPTADEQSSSSNSALSQTQTPDLDFDPQPDRDRPDPAERLNARKQTVRQQHSWQGSGSFATKAVLSALAVSAVPLMILGGYSYWQSQRTPRAAVVPLAEVQQAQQNLGLGAGVLAIATGISAALLAQRATRPVIKAAKVSSYLVNRLRRDKTTIDPEPPKRGELATLEANLQLLTQQLPSLLSTHESETEWLKVLMEVTQQIRASRSKEEVFRAAVTLLRQHLQTDRVVVLQFQAGEQGTFVEESVSQGWSKLLRSTITDPCFSSGYLDLYRQGRVRVIDNVDEADLEDCHIGLLERFDVKASLVAPIITEGQLFGLLIAHQCSVLRYWRAAEVDLFTQIAAQVGLALETVRLLDEVDQRAMRSQLFIELSRQIRTSLNAEDVLKTTVNEVRKAMNADRVIVYSFDEQWYGTVAAEAVLPGYPKAIWAKIYDPCFAEGYVDQYQSGRVQAVDNVHEAGLTDCHLKQLDPFMVKANLVAPILKDDKLFGLLIAHQCSGPRQWQPSEVDWFAQIATQVGYALDHARLLEQVNIENIQSKILSDLTRQIRASLIEDDVLKTTVTEARRALQTDRVIVYSFDEQWYGTVVAEAVLPGYPKALWANIKDPCFAEGYVDQYREGRVQAVANVELAGLTRCHLKQLEPYAVKANLVAPILKDDKLFGLLIAHQCSGPRQWQPNEIDLFTKIAVQVGFALDHARLLEQVDQAYQNAETTLAGQQQQQEALQRKVQDWLEHNEPAVKMLSTEMLKQMDGITTLYQHLKTYGVETQEILNALSQQDESGRQSHQVLSEGLKTAAAIQQSLVMTRTGLTSATQQLHQLDDPAQHLTEITQFIQQMTSQMKLQAMNAALEATRTGDSTQEFVSIGEKVMDLARQLESKTTELTNTVDQLHSQFATSLSTLEQESQQIHASVQLSVQAEQAIGRAVEVNGQFQDCLKSLLQLTQRQSESSVMANQMILEVASTANHTSEQLIAITKTFDQLNQHAHSETGS